jgi:dienelactone hydrolase
MERMWRIGSVGTAASVAIALATAAAAGCGSGSGDPDAAPADAEPGPDPDLAVESAGPSPVGTMQWMVEDSVRIRTLAVQAWYPATAEAAPIAAAGFPIEELEAEPNRTAYADLLAAAPAGCPTTTAHAARDATPAPGPHPVVMFSHCHECTRFSALAIAERLASHGFVVIAADHTDNTLWDQLDDTGVPLGSAFLEVRAADVQFVLDRVLAGAAEVPAALAATLDAAHVGVLGHSFGSVTAGRVAQLDDRIDAAFGLASPFENPFLVGVDLEAIDVPVTFLVAREDNSITELGNDYIRENFTNAPGPAWKLEMADAGHWSVSDLVGVVPGFLPGCGEDQRQTDGSTFTYLDPAAARGITASYVTAFFRATLEADAGARAYLTSNRPAGVIESAARP